VLSPTAIDIVHAWEVVLHQIESLASGWMEMRGRFEGTDDVLEAIGFLLPSIHPKFSETAKIDTGKLKELMKKSNKKWKKDPYFLCLFVSDLILLVTSRFQSIRHSTLQHTTSIMNQAWLLRCNVLQSSVSVKVLYEMESMKALHHRAVVVKQLCSVVTRASILECEAMMSPISDYDEEREVEGDADGMQQGRMEMDGNEDEESNEDGHDGIQETTYYQIDKIVSICTGMDDAHDVLEMQQSILEEIFNIPIGKEASHFLKVAFRRSLTRAASAKGNVKEIEKLARMCESWTQMQHSVEEWEIPDSRGFLQRISFFRHEELSPESAAMFSPLEYLAIHFPTTMEEMEMFWKIINDG
jgi:hypothetical protein